jgi:hypothetical protein
MLQVTWRAMAGSELPAGKREQAPALHMPTFDVALMTLLLFAVRCPSAGQPDEGIRHIMFFQLTVERR